MATSIGTKGAELNILVRQGATFGPYLITLTNPDDTPVSLIGATFRSQIRKTPNALLSEAITALIVYIDRSQGLFSFEFTAQDTASLSAGLSETDPESLYVWDLEMEDSTGRVLPLLYGNVNVFREVTKST